MSFQPLGGGRIRVWGGTSLREASQRLGFMPSEDEEEGFDTVGGLVFGRLNRIPVVGDEVEVDSGRLRVTQMNGRRIDYLLFVPD
jgi:CBS domain containing-hemolysin-like protein